jgi:hypothetical protein
MAKEQQAAKLLTALEKVKASQAAPINTNPIGVNAHIGRRTELPEITFDAEASGALER